MLTVEPRLGAEGDTVQVLFVGTPVHVKLTLPVTVESELRSNGYVALAPLESVAVVAPLAASAKSMPRPERLTVCVDGEALSVTVSVPVRGPAAVGAKAIWRVQEALTASVVPQVFAVIVKFVEMAVFESVSGSPPLLVSVTVCAAELCPTPVAPNATVPSGASDTPGAAVPTPVSATVCERN